MKVSQLRIDNFRGIKLADLFFPDHVVLIGDNNTGKSTIFEALDLVLGPDRLSRRSVIEEHDFHNGLYLPKDTEESPRITIEATAVEDDKEYQVCSNFKNGLMR